VKVSCSSCCRTIDPHSHENTGSCVDWYPTTCYNHPNFEIFTPPYLLNADGSLATRPTILTAASSVALGETISIQTDSPCTKFAVVRLSIVTHTINNDLRRIPLAIETEVAATATYEYTLRVPSNPNVALPGYYWLYAMNSDGVPSEGATVAIIDA
jgi:galactose oxidase